MLGRLRRLAIASGWSAVLICAPAIVVFANPARLPGTTDFGVYYAAAETLRYDPHANIYLTQTLAATTQAFGGCGPTVDIPYLYQPLTALLMEPLTLLPCHGAAALWEYANFALWFGVTAVLARQTWLRYGAGRALLVALVCLAFTPILYGVQLGQTHLVVFLCMLGGTALIERNHELAGGATLALGIVLKYLPGVLVLYYLLRGRWRAAVSAAVVTLALIAVELLIVGPQLLIESVTVVGPLARAAALQWQGGYWMSALPGGIVLAVVSAITCVITVVSLQLRRGSTSPNTWLGAWWSVTTALLVLPLVWWFYMTWLLPALLTCLDLLLERVKNHRRRWTWGAVAQLWGPLMLLALSYGLMLQPASSAGVAHFRLMAAGVVILWVICGALYLRSAGVRLPSRLSAHLPARQAPVETPA